MIIDGKQIAQKILDQIKIDLAEYKFRPRLIDVVVGEDPVVESYVRIKAKRAEEVGIEFEIKRFPADVSQTDLALKVTEMNFEDNLCGLIIQLPLPSHIDKQIVLDSIDPQLDVDVVTSQSLGELFTGRNYFAPATAGAIIKILEESGVNLKGKKVLVIGSGDLVGKPSAFLAMKKMATVTVANKATENLKELCLSADVIISGAGSPALIKADMVTTNTILIDAGTAESEGSITGDADFENIKDKVAMITPVPGGVGPVTVAMLLHNVAQEAKRN